MPPSGTDHPHVQSARRPPRLGAGTAALRHGAASLALAAGADLEAVQDRLGHASIVLTTDTYTPCCPTSAGWQPTASRRSSGTPAGSRPGQHELTAGACRDPGGPERCDPAD